MQHGSMRWEHARIGRQGLMSSKPHHLSRAVISPHSAIATPNGVGMSYVWKVSGAKYLLLKILLQIFHTISPQCSTSPLTAVALKPLLSLIVCHIPCSARITMNALQHTDN